MKLNLNRGEFLKNVAIGSVAIGMTSCQLRESLSNPKKTNVVILFIDDLGYGDLGCFGSKTNPTPYIDSLATEGTRLTMNYITNPPCSPSRCSLMMGMYAQRFGKFGMARGLPLPKDKPTIAEFMRNAGYVTGHVGKWDIGSEEQGPEKRGFMEVAKYNGKKYLYTKANGDTVYRTVQDGDNMVEFIERNNDNPFFLYFSPFGIHTPHEDVPEEFFKRAGGSKYGGAIVAIDDAIGKLLSVLKKHQLEDNTLIILTGDNGPHKPGTASPYTGGKITGLEKEGWVHTPGIAWWPGKIPAGKTFEGLACTLDYYATAAAVAGMTPPSHCDGKNLIPFLQGTSSGDVHEYLYWYNADPKDGGRHLSAVRWKDWRLVFKRKSKMEGTKKMKEKVKSWALYDLRQDPAESNDLCKKHPVITKHLIKKHKDFVSGLPPLSSIPEYSRRMVRPPEGTGWLISNGGK